MTDNRRPAYCAARFSHKDVRAALRRTTWRWNAQRRPETPTTTTARPATAQTAPTKEQRN